MPVAHSSRTGSSGRRRPSSRCLVAALAVLLLFTGGIPAAEVAPARPRVTLALKWYHQFQFAGYYAAVAQGYYAEEGLDVLLREPVDKRLPLELVTAGEAEYGVAAADLLRARAVGAPVVAVAAIFQHSPVVLLSREDRGLRRPSDLIGTTIMMEDNTAVEVKALLLREGIDLTSVRFVPHTWRVDELVDGTVDASVDYVIDEPNRLRERGVTPALLRPIDYGIDFYGDCLFTSERERAEHPERVAAVRRASLRGWAYALAHVEEMIDHILRLPGVAARGVTAEHLRYEAGQMAGLIQAPLVELGHMNEGRWRHMADTYKALGLVRSDFDLDGFLYDPAAPLRTRRWEHVLGGLAAGVVLVGGLALLWNRQLRQSVRQKTAALQASQAYVQDVLDYSQDAVFVHDADTGEILDVNRRMGELYGCTREQALRASISTLSQGESPYGPNEAMAWLVKARREGPQTFPWRARRLDGQLFWVEVSVRFTVIGGQKRFVVVARDISERRRAEEEQERNRQTYLDIYHSVSEAIYIHDRQGVFIDVNRGAELMYGYTREELIGKTPVDVGAPGRNDMAVVVRAMEEVTRTGKPQQFEFWGRRKNGEVFLKDVIINAGRYFGREVFITTARDITAHRRAEEERQRLQEQLAQSHKMESIGRVAGGVAHDFNNMLGVIIGRADLAMEQLGPDHPVHADLQEIARSARRSADLTRQLLAFARKQPVAPRVLDLNEAVGGTLKMLRRLIGEQVELDWRPAAGLWPVCVDPVQVDQVLANLCVNARDALPRGGRVVIETANQEVSAATAAERGGVVAGGYVRLVVSDNGCGMEADVLPHIFEPFYTTKAVGQGTGLGLATVYGIVSQNGGCIRATSEPGRGTRFEILLPRTAGEPAPAAPGGTGRAPQRAEPAARILLVEDEPALLDLCRVVLEQAGHQVRATGCPLEALRWLENGEQPDLLLTDIMMPELNGWELARRVKDRHPRMRVLYMSGYAADEVEGGPTGEVASSLLQKPFASAELLARVRELLGTPSAG